LALTRVEEETSRIVPYLAKSWDVSEDGTVYTFHLRDDVTWTDGTHNVRIPIVARPISIAAPGEVSGSGVAGSRTIPVTFGYTGPYTAAPHGLAPAVMTPGAVLDDPGNSFAPFGPGTTLHFINVPAGQAYADGQALPAGDRTIRVTGTRVLGDATFAARLEGNRLALSVELKPNAPGAGWLKTNRAVVRIPLST